MKKRKWLALLLCIAMVFSMLPTTVLAEDEGGTTESTTVTFKATAGTKGANDSEGYASLIDGKYSDTDPDEYSKWCVTSFSGAYIIFEASERISVNGYSIVTGNDNKDNSGRNPKTWTLYGCNDPAANAEAGRTSESWVEIAKVTNDTTLRDENYTKYDGFTCSAAGWYRYFKLEITAIQSGTVMQMSEFILDYDTCEHNWVKAGSIDPTCTEGGYDIEECSICGVQQTVPNEIPANGHTWNDTVVAPTCTKDGYTLQTCSVCGEEQKINIVAALGHDFGEDETCTRCGLLDPTPIQPTVGDGSAENPYEISTPGELYWFAARVNSGSISANAVLTANIAVNSDLLDSLTYDTDGNVTNGGNFYSWTPIGSGSMKYIGTFDGQGYTVSGLYFNDTQATYVGLFGYVGSGGKVSNVSVADSYIHASWETGGVCGKNYGGTIENCSNSGKVSGTGEYVGGVCGYNEYGTIKNCSNSGTVSVSDEFFVGGVCGKNYGGTIENCSNSGEVSGKGRVGGVCGDNFNNGIIKNCSNSGEVGGINSGYGTGGVCGANYSTIENCYNTGVVSGSSDYVGSVCGDYDSGTIKNCYYDNEKCAVGGIQKADQEGIAEGRTTAEFASGQVAYLLQSGQAEVDGETPLVWGQNIGTDAYPVLGGTKVYQNSAYAGCVDAPGEPTYSYSNTEEENIVYQEHDMHQVEAKAATCTEAGNVAYWICSYEEGVSYKDQNRAEKYTDPETPVIPALGHEYENGECTRCGLVNATPTKPAGSGTEDSPYQIGTPGELYWFAALVNGTLEDVDQNTSAWAVLTADITVNQDFLTEDGALMEPLPALNEWTPIGNALIQYTGTFDGRNYTVSGLYFNDTDTSYVGLFGYVGSGGKVSNVRVADSYIIAKQEVGGVCGWNKGTIENCSNSGKVSGSGQDIGGVCGYNGSSSTIKNCSNSGTVSGSNYVGGVCGNNNYGTIENCSNSGKVSGSGYSVGGVCGYNLYATIENCYNSGKVSGSDFNVGGVSGYNYGTIANCYNSGEVSGSSNYVGGVSGFNVSATVENCYYLNTCNAEGTTFTNTYGTSKTADEFASGQVAYLLQGTQEAEVWGQNIDKTEPHDAFPVLGGPKVYQNDTYAGCVGNPGEPTATAYSNTEKAPVYVSHDMTSVPAKAATCTEAGNVAYWICSYEEGVYYTDEAGTEKYAPEAIVIPASHNYVDGKCTVCGLLDPTPTQPKVGDGSAENPYQIGTPGQLYWFAALVNGTLEDVDQNTSAWAVLTADITVNQNFLTADGALMESLPTLNQWTPIGSGLNQYTGTFDGQGHIVTGLYFDDPSVDFAGLFGFVGSGGKVSDVGVADSYINAHWGVGGVCGLNMGTIENCSNSGAVGGDAYVGGMCGLNMGTIENCYNSGKVSGSSYVGGVCGNNDSGIIENCYYLDTCNAEGTTFTNEDGTSKTKAEFASGQVAYLLQSGQAEDSEGNIPEVWGQNIDQAEPYDAFPVLGGAKVYQNNIYDNNTIGCEGNPGTPIAIAYSNTKTRPAYKPHEMTLVPAKAASCEEDGWKEHWACSYEKGVYYTDSTGTEKYDPEEIVIPASHNFENGVCTRCGLLDPAPTKPAGSGTEESPYLIGTPGELYWFAALVNGTLTDGTAQNTSAWAVLTANIIVNLDFLTEDGALMESLPALIEWTPIGWYDDDTAEGYSYTGTFNGQNYTISGLYFNDPSVSYAGLFGYVGSGGKVSNVGVADSYINAYQEVGGVCGWNEGTIENCYNSGTVSGSGDYDVGGVCGWNRGAIENCYNSGKVSASGYAVGGVCGWNDSSTGSGTIKNCYNIGAVSGSNWDFGGVCGWNDGTIANCYNSGKVSGSGEVGGVCGGSTGTIENCYNSGEVSGDGDWEVGGVCGYNDGTIVNCYYLDTCNAEGTTFDNSDGTSKTKAEFASGEVAYLLQDGQTEDSEGNIPEVWGQNIGTDAYPVLGGPKVYRNESYPACADGNEPVYSYANEAKAPDYPEHVDTDHDGKCDYCGYIMDGIGAKLYGYTLSLNGNIGVNFYMELSEEILADRDAYMQFTLPNGTMERVSVADATQKDIDGKTYYVFSCEVAAKEMTAEIKAQIISGGAAGTEYTYTVKDYADYILAHPETYGDVTALVTAMLNYGAYSQTYFNYNTENPANSDLTDAQKQLPDTTAEELSAYAPSYTPNESYTGTTAYYGSSLVLKSETDIKHYFSYDSSVSLDRFTCTDGNDNSYEIAQSGNYLYVRVADIAAKNLGVAVTLTLYENDEAVGTIRYSPLSYAYSILSASSTDDALRNTVKALYQYYLAADAYFNAQSTAE